MSISEVSKTTGILPPPMGFTPSSVPQDTSPAVTIRAITGRVVAGTAFTITVDLDEGEHWFWIPQDLSWSSEPKVQYSAA